MFDPFGRHSSNLKLFFYVLFALSRHSDGTQEALPGPWTMVAISEEEIYPILVTAVTGNSAGRIQLH